MASKTVELVKKAEDTFKGELTISVKSKDKSLTKEEVNSILSIKLDGVDLNELSKNDIDIKNDHKLEFTLKENSGYKFKGSNVIKINKYEADDKLGDWTELKGNPRSWTSKAELELEKLPGKVRVFHKFPSGFKSAALDGTNIPVTGLLVEPGKKYVVTASTSNNAKLIIDPLENNPYLSMEDGKIVFTAPKDVSEVTLNLAEEIEMQDYYTVLDALVGDTKIGLHLSKSNDDLKIKNIYSVVNGHIYKKSCSFLVGDVVVVYLADEITKVGEEIGLLTVLEDGRYVKRSVVKSEFIKIDISHDEVKAGDKILTGKTEADATVTLKREGFEKPFEVKAGKDGKFSINLVTGLKGEEIIELVAKLGSDKKSETLKIKVPKAEVVNDADRISGKDRYQTAVEISQKLFENDVKPKTIILASGEDKATADALAAGPLSIKNASPILLVKSSSIPTNVLDEIKRLSPENIIIVGGENSVGQNLVKELEDLNIKVSRISGKDRFETSLKVAEELDSKFGFKGLILTNGFKTADALAVSGYAAQNALAIVLTDGKDISSELSEYIKEKGVKEVQIVGGNEAVSTKFESGLKDLFTTRIGGKDRFETATLLAAKAYPDAKSAVLVNGLNNIDALASALYASTGKMPIILVNKDNAGKFALAYLKDNKIENAVVVGGVNSVSDSVIEAFKALNPPKTEKKKDN